jgi:hypothetical protein
MATPVEKLHKEIATLELKRGELDKKKTTNRQRMAEVKAQRSALLISAADGDAGAQRDKKTLDHEYRNCADADETFVSALAEINGKIEAKGRELTRSERAAVIAQLEVEIKGLDALDAKVSTAIRDLKAATASLFTACDAVAGELRKLDAVRFDGGYPHKLRAGIRDAIMRAVVNVDHAPSAEAESFIEAVRIMLRSACGQLSYEILDENEITPAKGERLYRTQGWIGFRGVELAPGKLIALRDDEAAPHLKTKFLIEEPAQSA